MGHIFEHVAIALQNRAGCKSVSFGKTRSADAPGVYHVVYQYEEEWVGKAAGELSLDLLHHLLPDELCPGVEQDSKFDFEGKMEDLIRAAERRALGPSTGSLVRAAEERDIPWLRLNDYSLVQFGHGQMQQRIQATITSETRHIAVEIASDKEMTNQVLGDVGLPVPKQYSVYREESALRAAKRLGYPLVVKPYNANHGRGVSIGLTTDEQVIKAFNQAREHSRCVLLETYISGFDHRMLVVNNELVAVSKRVPGHVVGDGERTISQLVDQVNEDPRRGIGHEKVLTRLELDAQAERLLKKGGHTAETVLPAGTIFYIRSTGNLSTGGTAIDVTDIVHPDNREMAVRAAATVGLDVCGVDFLTPDISRSYKEIGGGICELNAAPGFRMHVAPSEGQPRDVAGAVIDMLFPQNAPSRIPIASITGTNGKTTTTRMLAHIHKMAGEQVGMTTTDGIYIDGQLSVEGDMTGPVSSQMVLRDPTVTVAILETARGGLLKKGLGYRRPNVACCLNVQSDHLGLRGIDTLDQLAEVKRIPIEVASDTVVLNADDPRCLRMAVKAVAENVCYVTLNPEHALVREHIRSGGHAVALEKGINGEMISIFANGSHIPLLWTHLIPATLEGKAMHNVQNAMFAAGMAYAMGVKLDDIRQGLRTFDTTYFQAPGRMNVFDQNGFKVILDYGHNPAAVEAMCTLVDRLAESDALGTNGKRICVLSAPGDRRDQDIIETAKVAAGRFDHYICKRDDHPRGRGEDEVPRMLKESLMASGVGESQIELIISEEDAVETALEKCQQGDLLLIFADHISRTWKQIVQRGEAQTEKPEPAVNTGMQIEENYPEFEPPAGQKVVRDGRGVLLAVDEEAD
jgi:cyanophycin synthetase